MDFELEPRFFSKFEIQKVGYLGSLLQLFANPPLPKFGQGVIQGVLKTLLFHLKGMYKLTLQIEEDMEF
jgi:hypothetical protein